MAEEGRPPARLSALQQRQRELWEALCAASGGFEAGYLRIIAEAASGGAKAIEIVTEVEHVRTTQPDGSATVERRVLSERTKERDLLPDWRAAMEILARRNPQRWSSMQRREISGRGGSPLEAQVNVGAAAIESPTVSAAVDELLRQAAEGSVAGTDDEGNRE